MVFRKRIASSKWVTPGVMPQKQVPEHGPFVSISLAISSCATSGSRVGRGVKLGTGVGEAVMVGTGVGLGVLEARVGDPDVGIFVGCMVTVSVEIAGVTVGVREGKWLQLVSRMKQPKIRR